ncbi:MAG TPA: PRC-barrel domain-containing protein [Anaerolineales bacterium]|nr:PRC-barrel domain-containing protein [Anaerolineales bacterium]
MLRSLNELIGYDIMAKDGQIGKAHDILFSDEDWEIRYLVVDTGPWILGKKVLISMHAIQQPVWTTESIPVDLTREEVKSSPDVDLAKPVSRLYEEKLHAHYDWPIYWGAARAMPLSSSIYVNPNLFAKQDKSDEEESTHLRSSNELTAYEVSAVDGEAGVVTDFILEDENWQIRYMVVDTGSKLDVEKKVLVALEWINDIDVASQEISIDLNQEAIRFSPSFDPNLPVNRQYEEVVYDYHGRPKYWHVVE